MFGISIILTLVSATVAIASRDHVDKRSFQVRDDANRIAFRDDATGATLSYVTNCDICENTPGVNQYSGYVTIGNDEHYFFWFFEAQSNSANAPLVLWTNGLPGCSSMVDLFQQSGPCQFNDGSGPGSTPQMNPYSWNKVANVMYLDNLVGSGFSYGHNREYSSATAAEVVWKIMQTFLEHFTQYQGLDFGMFSDLYGGIFGVAVASYFGSQNAAIEEGTLHGLNIPVKVLGIGDPWIDANIQYKAEIDFAQKNSYRSVINSKQATSFLDLYNQDCRPQIEFCRRTNSDGDCFNATITCSIEIENKINQAADFNAFDISAPSNTSFPSESYVSYLQNPTVLSKIGAQVNYRECNDAPFTEIASTGDLARSSVPSLNALIQNGTRVLVWQSDRDWNANSIGVEQVIAQLKFPKSDIFQSTKPTPYTVNGKTYGEYKTAGMFSYLKVYNAGLEIAAYQPQVALQAFNQTIHGQPLIPT